MSRKGQVGFIGIGAMGGMLVNAHFTFGDKDAYRLTAASRDEGVLTRLKAAHPALAIAAAADLIARCDLVFVCVPPLPYLDVVNALSAEFSADKTLVCISNGVEIDAVGDLVEAAVVKVIPSVTHRVGRGVSLVSPGPRATEAQVREVEAFIRPFALPVRVAEADMRIASNVTGCGPAIFAHFMDLLVQVSAGQARELDPSDLYRMASETFCATAGLIEDGMTPHGIAEEAATGGGTTEIALQTLTEPLRSAIFEMIAATKAREMDIRARSGRASREA